MKKNILLVEYDNHTIDKIRDILSAPIFDISIAESGDTAKKLLKKQNYDLVITAAMLPKFHGFDLSKFISTNFPSTRIIVMSNVYKGIEYRRQAINEFGANEFIEKPINDEIFRKTVYSLLDITEEDIRKEFDSGSTQIPTSDTKKIRIQESSETGQLSSNDIFGDIIDKVEKEPFLSINLDEEKIEEKAPAGEDKKAGSTHVLDKEYFMGKTNIQPDTRKFNEEKKIDFSSLVKTEAPAKSSDRSKEIENDIAKKLEETLSGLGLEPAGKKASKASTVIAPAPPVENKTRVKEEKGEEIEGYEILEMIARGGMAEIYKAKRKGVKGFEKVIVVKKILSGYGEDHKYIEMFVDEAKIAAELSHPNIVQIYDFGKKDNFYFIAMEYVDGKDLRLILNKLMERNSLLEEHLTISLILKILEALSYAHEAKDGKGHNLDIVHRDISPPNILVSYSGEVKLTDFGVSKASNKSHHTLSGALKGKLLYMSPEQANADKTIDNRSDIYSVGVILFELLTGKKLFSGSSEMEVLHKVQGGKILMPSEVKPGIDPELEKIILKAVNINRDERYRNATEMITALENYLYGNYNHVPTSVHLQHKISELFKDEILKAGIILNLKPLPYQIERIVPPPTIESIEESSETLIPEEEEQKDIIELTEESKLEETVTDPEPVREPSFKDQPVIELNDEVFPLTAAEPSFFRDEKEDIPERENEREELIITDSRLIRKEKTRPFFKILLLIVLLAFSVYYFFLRENGLLSNLISGKPGTENVSESISGQQKEPVKTTSEDTISSAVLPSETLTGETGENVQNDGSDMLAEKDQKTALSLLKQEDPEKQKKEEADQKKAEEENKRLLEEQKALEIKRQQKIEEDRKKKKAEEERKKKEEEEKQKAEEEEQKRLEAERIRLENEELAKKELEMKKKLEAEKNRIKTGQIISLAEADVKPEALSTPAPKLSRSMTLRQSVIVMALIDHNGNVEKVNMLRKSNNKKIDDIIIETIISWKYKPAEKDGVKVKVWKTINLQ